MPEPRRSPIGIRSPVPSDAPALAALAGELGYPTSAEALLGRLAALHPTDAAVMVATDPADRAIGWCHVEVRRTLVEPLSALVLGMVVTDRRRSSRIGAQLLEAVERWAIARGCVRMVIATRLTRERAHAFYAREGYTVSKTSYFLAKTLI